MKVINTEKKERLFKILFIVFIIANVITIQLFNQHMVETYFLKLDLTENSLYELTPITHEVIETITEPVKITVFSPEEDFVIMLKEILKRYEKSSSKIKLTFIDPFENPVLIDQFLTRGIHIQANDIVFEGKDGFQIFSIDEMYIFNGNKTEITGLNAEQQITTALLNINTKNNYTAAFTDGHNERPSESLIELFIKSSFKISRGNITTVLQQKPDIIILASPGRDFLNEEIDLLETYLDKGGSLMIFLEPSLNSLERLDSLIEQWGIIPGDKLVFEQEAYTGNNPINIVPMYSPHTINRFFQKTRVFITMPSSRNLLINPNIGTAYDVRSVLNSTPDSYGKIGYQFSRTTREIDDTSGPFYLALSSIKEIVVDGSSEKARIFVAGSRSLYGDDLLGFTSYGNSDFLIQVINWLSERDDALNIPSKNIKAAPLNIKRNQALLLGGIITLLIPLSIIFFGIIVFIRRKKL